MGPRTEPSKQLQEYLSDIAKQLKELRAGVSELKKQQAEILVELRSQPRAVSVDNKGQPGEEKVRTREEKAPAAAFKMYCTQCLEMKPIAAPRRVIMPDGSLAIQGKCADCGTTTFRLTEMSGTIMDRAATTRLGRIED